MTIPYRQYAAELFADLAGEEVNSDAAQELLEAKGVDYDHTDVAEIEALVEQLAAQTPPAAEARTA
ncbi:hypothetical protein ACLQ25_09590 [Micromonospora sp. DT44]|uniref:hypothetical protein n=1 Tax=Micromonospora sp. DT44 TaxID=3393439 RepID=UPI003CE8C761